MGLKEFAQKVKTTAEERLGREHQVCLREVIKNNHVVLQGLVIMPPGQNVSPTIYLEPFWTAYEEGMPLEKVTEEILRIYKEDGLSERMDMEFFQVFDLVKDRICYRLIHAAKNEELVKEIPHIEFLDLAICFYYAYQGKAIREGSILIYNSHMEMWGTNTLQLLKLAQENSPRLFPWVCSSINQVIGGLMQGRQPEEGGEQGQGLEYLPEECCMKILSNKSHTQGAACILYPGLLQILAEREKGDFYILPSSVHEVILLKAAGEDGEVLKRIIEEVNRTQVEPEEVLSDSLYYFDHQEKKIRIL